MLTPGPPVEWRIAAASSPAQPAGPLAAVRSNMDLGSLGEEFGHRAVSHGGAIQGFGLHLATLIKERIYTPVTARYPPTGAMPSPRPSTRCDQRVKRFVKL